MSDFILSASSTVDIPREVLEKENIKWIGFPFQIDDVDYIDDLGLTVKLNDFYQKLNDGAIARTSQITYIKYIEFFEKLLEEDKDILHVTLSSGLTGGVQQAYMAQEKLEEKYPDRKIYILDSLTATSCEGLFVLGLNEMRKEGFSIEEVYNWGMENRYKVNSIFFTSDLTYLVRGGRVSKAAGSFGNLLNICPIMDTNTKGEIVVRDKIRTKKKAMKALVNKISDRLIRDFPYKNEIYIVHAYAPEDAEDLRERLLDELDDYSGEIKIYEIGTTVGSHVGPGLVGAGFWGKEKDE
ncbi:DegV family protein [Anaerococcus murdochii]|uniref:DegV family protein n=1 Tax=Anaerococcus murdochii TaxID=411577 RepID=UPI0032B4AC41